MRPTFTQNGFLNIHKPVGMSSNQALGRLKRIAKFSKLGHAGTLDPLAEGVLPVAANKATRLLPYIPTDKHYRAEFWLGITSTTDDLEGEKDYSGKTNYEMHEISEKLPQFTGSISQTVPLFSAVHKDGKRLYDLARKGEEVSDLPSKTVEIYSYTISELGEADSEHGPVQAFTADIHCSSGTYIRSLARDLGKSFGCGGLMAKLMRTEAASLNVTNAISLEQIQTPEDLESHLIDPISLVPGDVVELDKEQFANVQHGSVIMGATPHEGHVKLIHDNKLAALAEANGKALQPRVVLV